MTLPFHSQILPPPRSQQKNQTHHLAVTPAILIVDDDPDILTALRDLLEHDEFHVIEASNYRDALEQIQAINFATVLLDVGLPDGDGLAVLESIQTIAPSLPVIVLTAITAQNYRARALSRGAFSCLPKPYHRDELRGIVRRAIMATHSSMPSGT